MSRETNHKIHDTNTCRLNCVVNFGDDRKINHSIRKNMDRNGDSGFLSMTNLNYLIHQYCTILSMLDPRNVSILTDLSHLLAFAESGNSFHVDVMTKKIWIRSPSKNSFFTYNFFLFPKKMKKIIFKTSLFCRHRVS